MEKQQETTTITTQVAKTAVLKAIVTICKSAGAREIGSDLAGCARMLEVLDIIL